MQGRPIPQWVFDLYDGWHLFTFTRQPPLTHTEIQPWVLDVSDNPLYQTGQLTSFHGGFTSLQLQDR